MAPQRMTDEEIEQLALECESCPFGFDSGEPLAVAWQRIHRLVDEVRQTRAEREVHAIAETTLAGTLDLIDGLNIILAGQATAAEAERDALRAIIEGRTVPPTDEEIAAHCATGGRWRSATPAHVVCSDGATFLVPARSHEASTLPGTQTDRDLHLLDEVVARWWPLDAEGRPCAWPSVPARSTP